MVTAKYSIDGAVHTITGTESSCFIQLDVLLTIYGDRFHFIGRN